MAADEHAYWLFRKDTADFSFDSLKDNRHSQVLWTGEVLKTYEDRLPLTLNDMSTASPGHAAGLEPVRLPEHAASSKQQV